MANPSIPCPRVSGVVDDFGAEQPAKYRDSVLLPLRQYWNGPEAMPVEKGNVCVGAADEGLCFYAYCIDSDIFSLATTDNQKMWTLGDVAEFFVKPGADRTDYWEIHVNPKNFLMDIHIPDRERFIRGEVTWEQVVAPSSGTRWRVWVRDDGWAVEICVPWRAFGFETVLAPGTIWHFAVCRYNYNGDLENPEHSSTAHLTQFDFHRWEEFTELVF